MGSFIPDGESSGLTWFLFVAGIVLLVLGVISIIVFFILISKSKKNAKRTKDVGRDINELEDKIAKTKQRLVEIARAERNKIKANRIKLEKTQTPDADSKSQYSKSKTKDYIKLSKVPKDKSKMTKSKTGTAKSGGTTKVSRDWTDFEVTKDGGSGYTTTKQSTTTEGSGTHPSTDGATSSRLSKQGATSTSGQTSQSAKFHEESSQFQSIKLGQNKFQPPPESGGFYPSAGSSNDAGFHPDNVEEVSRSLSTNTNNKA